MAHPPGRTADGIEISEDDYPEMEAVAADAQDRLSQWVTRTLAARKSATGSVMPLGELLDLSLIHI